MYVRQGAQQQHLRFNMTTAGGQQSLEQVQFVSEVNVSFINLLPQLARTCCGFGAE